MTAALYRVSFDQIRTLPGCKPMQHFEPAKMPPGWRVEVTAAEVLIISPPASPAIGEDTAAAMERDANGIPAARACIVTAIPRNLCALPTISQRHVDMLGWDGDLFTRELFAPKASGA